MDWKGTVMHELAHKFGLQHAEYLPSSWKSSLMYPYWKNLQMNIFGERYVNSFAVDDINRIQAHASIIKTDDFQERLKNHFGDLLTEEDCDTLTGAETVGNTKGAPAMQYSEICKENWLTPMQ